MSLTNDQITAKNFKDFYNGIRPYLNGQVPTFANAFNKSDLYSTDEKIVGCWLDGKPLYQKAFQGSWPLSASGDPTVLSDITITNAEHLVSVELIQESSTLGDNYIAQVVVAGITQQYKLRLKPTNNLTASTIVVKYTKTTDTAIKVGDGNDYSTDEQIVGTWIDGKPVYQITVTGTTATGSGDVGATILPASQIPIDTLIGGDGTIVAPSGANIPIFPSYVASTGRTCVLWSASGDTAGLRISTNIDAHKGNPVIVTIRYTKTTD